MLVSRRSLLGRMDSFLQELNPNYQRLRPSTYFVNLDTSDRIQEVADGASLRECEGVQPDFDVEEYVAETVIAAFPRGPCA
jgi:hypothetical protein